MTVNYLHNPFLPYFWREIPQNSDAIPTSKMIMTASFQQEHDLRCISLFKILIGCNSNQIFVLRFLGVACAVWTFFFWFNLPSLLKSNSWMCGFVCRCHQPLVPSVGGRHVLTLRCSSLHSSVDKVLLSLVRAFTAEHPDELECLQLVLYFFLPQLVWQTPLIPFKILDTRSELLSTTACDKVWMSLFLYIIDVWASIMPTVVFLWEWWIYQTDPSGCCGRLEPQFHAGIDEEFDKGACDDMVQ